MTGEQDRLLFVPLLPAFRPDVPLIPDVSLTCGGRRVCIRRSWYTCFVGRHTRVRRPPKDGGMFERRGRQGENDSLPMIIMQVVRDRNTSRIKQQNE